MNAEQAAIAARIAACRFYDIVKLAKACNNDAPLGIDVNRHFAGGGSKAKFAQWCLSRFALPDLEAKLPEYEELARAYYATNPVRRNPAPNAPRRAPRRNTTPRPAATTAAPTQEADEVDPAPETYTEQTPVQDEPATEAASELERIIRQVAGGAVNEAAVRRISREEAEAIMARGRVERLEIRVTAGPVITTTELPAQHAMFPRLLKLCSAKDRHGNRFNVWIAGPAGSGKTTAAKNVAKVLGLEFYPNGSMDSDFRLVGYMNAAGEYVPGTIYKAWKEGGVILFDECDGNHEAVMLALNGALANGWLVFPNGERVERHPDCVVIAAANTWGAGATFEYVGRLKQDAASMDRFKRLPWDYDTAFEVSHSGNEAWARKVIRWRERVRSAGIKHIISPRATFDGADLLAQGVPEAEVIAMTVSAGLTPAQWTQVQ